MKVVLVRFRVKPQFVTKFIERVGRQAQDSVEAEPACRRFDVCVDPNDVRRVCLYEIYDDEAAFATHLRSRHYGAFEEESRDWIDEKIVDHLVLRDAGVRAPGAWLAQ